MITEKQEAVKAAQEIINQIEKVLVDYTLDSLKTEDEYNNLELFLDKIIDHCEECKEELAILEEEEEGEE